MESDDEAHDDPSAGLLGSAPTASQDQSFAERTRMRLRGGAAKAQGHLTLLLKSVVLGREGPGQQNIFRRLCLLLIPLAVLALCIMHGLIGVMYEKDKCEAPLALWNYAQGSITLGLLFIPMIAQCFTDRCPKTELPAQMIISLNAVLFVISTIYGSMLVYGIDPVVHICPKFMYNYTWWVLTVFWTVLCTVWTLGCCVACCCCCSAFADALEKPYRIPDPYRDLPT